jgi:hypothetical protein
VSGTSGFDHREDAGLNRLWQLRPGMDNGGQVGVGSRLSYYALQGSILGSSWGTDRVGFSRIRT